MHDEINIRANAPSFASKYCAKRGAYFQELAVYKYH